MLTLARFVAATALFAAPALGQPRLLINAKTTVSTPTSLVVEFNRIKNGVTEPQWIGYSVPALPTARLGCDYVRDGFGPQPGVIHLEPAVNATVLFRVEPGKVRVRVLSEYCEIDAGGLEVHWLEGVKPAESIALLRGFVAEQTNVPTVIAAHRDGPPALIDMVRTEKDSTLRKRLMAALESTKDPRATQFFESLLR